MMSLLVNRSLVTLSHAVMFYHSNQGPHNFHTRAGIMLCDEYAQACGFVVVIKLPIVHLTLATHDLLAAKSKQASFDVSVKMGSHWSHCWETVAPLVLQ
jgi:hypothetical protein